MLVGAALLGAVTYFSVLVRHVAVSLLCAVFLTVLGAVMAAVESRRPMKYVLLPLLGGSVLSVVLVALWFLFFVLGLDNPFESHFIIPMCGMMSAAVSMTCGKALNIYYSGLDAQHTLYNYLIGNGATPAEALRYFRRRSLERCLIPMLHRMALMSVPLGSMCAWVLIMAAVPVRVAFLFEVLLLAGMTVCVMLALWVTLFLSKYYHLDQYDTLKTQ